MHLRLAILRHWHPQTAIDTSLLHDLQELGRELEAQAAAAAAANAELTQLRGRAREADAAEAANSAMAKDNAALRRQLEEVMLSHDAAVQSKDRALAQVQRPPKRDMSTYSQDPLLPGVIWVAGAAVGRAASKG